MKLVATIRNGGETKQIEAEADAYVTAREKLWAQVPDGWVMLFVRQE